MGGGEVEYARHTRNSTNNSCHRSANVLQMKKRKKNYSLAFRIIENVIENLFHN